MSGGKSIDPCCVSETFISPRQKSKLGAQQRPIEQRCSAWLVHLQFAPKKHCFFSEVHFIPKTSCPERIYVSFSARFWCIFNCNQARWSKHVGWFFGDWCAPMFFVEDGNTWKMCRICRIGGVRHPKSALMRVDFPCQACETWAWQVFGIRRAGAHFCLDTSCFDQLVSLPWQCVKLYVFVTCLCVNLSSSHFTVMILRYFDLRNLGVQVNPELGTQLCCQSWQIAMSLEPWNSAVLWRPRMLRSCTPHPRHSDWAPKLESWKVGIQVTETGDIWGSPHRISWNMIRDSCRSTWWLSLKLKKKPGTQVGLYVEWWLPRVVRQVVWFTLYNGTTSPRKTNCSRNSTLHAGFEIHPQSDTVCKLTCIFSECLKNPRIHESPSTCVMLRKFHWLILAISSFCPGGRSTDYPDLPCGLTPSQVGHDETVWGSTLSWCSIFKHWNHLTNLNRCHDMSWWLTCWSIVLYHYSPDLNAFETTNQPSKGRDTGKHLNLPALVGGHLRMCWKRDKHGSFFASWLTSCSISARTA